MRKLALQLVYQGSDFSGYQIQPEKRTVQSVLEKALLHCLPDAQGLICAGRTDAGVHAYAQLVHLETAQRFPIEKLPLALNHHLPPDLRVWQAWEVSSEFSARFSALARHYRYLIQTRPGPPHQRQLAWQSPFEIDFMRLQQAWPQLMGTHDFAAFCKRGSYREDRTQIDLKWAHVWQQGSWWVLELIAQSFLYNMVRTLVGTAIDIARGHFPVDHFQACLNQADRALVGLTAPPEGLYLFNVIYPAQYGIEMMQPGLHDWPVSWVDPQLKSRI